MALLLLIPWFIVVSSFGFILETEFHNINASFDCVLEVEPLGRITLISNATSVRKIHQGHSNCIFIFIECLFTFDRKVIHLTRPSP